MKKLLQFSTNEGEDFFVEVTESSVEVPMRGGSSEAASRGIIQNASGSFEKALKPLKEISNSIINSIKEIANSPDEIEVGLGLKFTATAGVILTSLESEANLKIVLKWAKSKTDKQ